MTKMTGDDLQSSGSLSVAIGPRWVLVDESLVFLQISALSTLAVELTACGLSAALCISLFERALSLRIGDEVIQAAVVDDRCVLVAQAGEVLGFSDDPEVVDEVVAWLHTARDRHSPGASSTAARLVPASAESKDRCLAD